MHDGSPEGHALVVPAEYAERAKFELWQYDQEGTREPILSDPTVVEGNVVLASDGGKVTVLNSAGSRVADVAIAEDRVRAPVTMSGNSVYVHTLDELVLGFVIEGNSIVRDWEIQLQGF